MRRLFLFSGIATAAMIFFCFSHFKNNEVEVFLAPLKNNARGAYTLIHDDFGGGWASGIENFADTMAWRKKIPFCFAVIAGECNVRDLENANRLISHGHQVINHSMYHKCGIKTEWCTKDHWNENNFHEEIDSSTAVILRMTGNFPAFFAFPFDQHTDTMLTYLKLKGYLGVRAGIVNSLQDPQLVEKFILNYRPFKPEDGLEELNGFAAEAIEQRQWAIREVHGVSDGSWGPIALEEYASHLNFLQSKVNEGALWVATLSDMYFYQMVNKKYKVKAVMEEENKLMVIEIGSQKKFWTKEEKKKYEQAMRTATTKEVTMLIGGLTKDPVTITQSGKKLIFRRVENKVMVNVDPDGGNVKVNY